MNISDLPLHHLSTTLKDNQAFDLANSFLLKPNGLSIADLDRLFGVMHPIAWMTPIFTFNIPVASSGV